MTEECEPHYIVYFFTNVEKQTIHKCVNETKCIFSPSFRQHILVRQRTTKPKSKTYYLSIHTQCNKTQCKSCRNSMTLSLKNIITSTSAPNFTLKKIHIDVGEDLKEEIKSNRNIGDKQFSKLRNIGDIGIII